MDAPSAKRPRLSPAKPECFFGDNCYRLNPQHFKEYAHPHLAKLGRKIKDINAIYNLKVESEVTVIKDQLKVFMEVCKDDLVEENVEKPVAPIQKKVDPNKKSLILRKLDAAQPMSFFLTKVKDSPETHNDMKSIYLTDLLHPSLGELRSSVQINFMIEWDWLKMNYEVTKNEKKPLLLIYGEDNTDLAASKLPDNVRAVQVKPRFPFGKHHTKMMIFRYNDQSVRIIISTANLIGSDWENRTQGVWVGPKCPLLKNGDNGDSKTGFKSSLLRYLNFYQLSPLKPYIDSIKQCDFSSVNVFFLGSVPNSHKSLDLKLWGWRQLSEILRRNIPPEMSKWPLILQCSSIGSLGHNENVWFRDEIGRALAATGKMTSDVPEMSMIYPCKNDVMNSYDGILGGGCLPYSRKTHEKQPWLQKYLCRWRADNSNRSRAMPHIKTYTRVSEDLTKSAFFVMSSANLSKAAWGQSNKARDSLQIQSYEAGVLFLPRFLVGKDYFELGKDLDLPYDLPLRPYHSNDSSWFFEYLR